MTESRRALVLRCFTNFTLGIVYLVGIWMMWMAWGPVTYRFEFLETEIITPEVHPGEELVVKRVFIVKEQGGTADIDRKMTCEFGPPENRTRITKILPSTGRDYRVGLYDEGPFFTTVPNIPEEFLPNGSKCVMRYDLEYKVNFLRSVTQPTPNIEFTIKR